MKHLSLPNDSLRNVLLLSAVFCALCSLPVHAESDVDEAPLLMLRFSKEHSDTEEHWANMLSILRQYPECCDEVWFSTGTTVPPLEVHAAHVEMMKRGKADLQRLGIGTSVQVQMTIGHGDDNHPLYEFGTLGIPVLPGMGRSLGTLTRDELSPVSIYGEPSSAVQRVRQQMDERAPSPVLCLSLYVGLLIPRVLADGTLRTVGLLNGRIDTQGPIRLCLRSLPSDVQKVTRRELRRKPVKLRVERDEDGVAYVSVPSIGAWNAGFLEIGTVSRK